MLHYVSKVLLNCRLIFLFLNSSKCCYETCNEFVCYTCTQSSNNINFNVAMHNISSKAVAHLILVFISPLRIPATSV